jgi:hypothetical protein
LQGILNIEDLNIETKLNSAWLLSHIGNLSGVKVAVEASKITKGFWIFENHPYEVQATETLMNLLKTKKAKLDIQTVTELSDSLSNEMSLLLNRLQH